VAPETPNSVFRLASRPERVESIAADLETAKLFIRKFAQA